MTTLIPMTYWVVWRDSLDHERLNGPFKTVWAAQSRAGELHKIKRKAAILKAPYPAEFIV